MGSWTTPNLDPAERAFARHFGRDECLYRDTLGRRVLADCEGKGVWEIEGPALVSCVVDGLEAENGPNEFEQSLRLVSMEEGEVEVRVRQPGREAVGDAESVPLPYGGSGWLIRCAGEVFADGEADSANSCSSFPTPFFRRLEGRGAVSILRAPEAWRKASLEIDAKGTSHPHPVHGCRSVLNELTMTVEVPDRGAPLRLWRTYDRFHGRQRARVFANEVPVGWWRDALEDRGRRISTSAFGFHAPGGTVRIKILPQPGTALWSFGVMEALVSAGPVP